MAFSIVCISVQPRCEKWNGLLKKSNKWTDAEKEKKIAESGPVLLLASSALSFFLSLPHRSSLFLFLTLFLSLLPLKFPCKFTDILWEGYRGKEKWRKKKKKDNNFKALASRFTEEDIFGASIFNLWAKCGPAMLKEHMCRQPYSWVAPLDGEDRSAPLRFALCPAFAKGSPVSLNEKGSPINDPRLTKKCPR